MKRFSFLIISVFPFFLSAQVRSDSLRREVTIEKDFTPIVRDASKINTLPEVEAPTVTKQSIRYSDWTVPTPLEPCWLPAVSEKKPKKTNRGDTWISG